MKTPEKIRKGQQACGSGSCDECPYSNNHGEVITCCEELTRDTLAYIQQLEQERDALIAALKRTDEDCEYCKHAMQNSPHCDAADGICERCDLAESCRCITCTRMNSNWEWCGVKHE